MPVKSAPRTAQKKPTEVKAKPAAKSAPKSSTARTAARPKATTAVKSAPAKKAATPTRRTPAKPSTPVRRTAVAKATPAKKNSGPHYELDLFGFVPGTDGALIAEALVRGGASREEVNSNAYKAIEKANGIATRTGGEKNIPSLTAGILSKLKAKGYTIESSFRVVPPADIEAEWKKQEATAKRRQARAVKK